MKKTIVECQTIYEKNRKDKYNKNRCIRVIETKDSKGYYTYEGYCDSVSVLSLYNVPKYSINELFDMIIRLSGDVNVGYELREDENML